MEDRGALAALRLGTCAEAVYEAFTDHPTCGVADLAELLTFDEHEVRAALDTLFRLSLLRHSIDVPGRIHPVPLRVALRTRLVQQQDELAAQHQELVRHQAALAATVEAYASLPLERETAGTERLIGMDAVHDRLEHLARTARAEVLRLVPGGAQPDAALAAGKRNDSTLLGKRVVIHTVLSDEAREDPGTLAYAQWLIHSGGEVRMAPVIPTRLLLIDRRVVLLPIDPDDSRAGAIQITERGIVPAVRALFERIWSMANPVDAGKDHDPDDLTGQERGLLRLLAQGMTDETAARRLGFSPRTGRRMMAGLMERLGARSRFEAGLLASQRGWL